MRYAILGDVHANKEALEAVLTHAQASGVQAYAQVGDVVGYGPDPAYCIDRLRELDCKICLGNHDAAVVRRLPLDVFNPFAKMALEWTMFELKKAHRDFLSELPLQLDLPEIDGVIAHGSLYKPESFDYVRSLASAARSLEMQTSKLCFVGHSHQPCLFVMYDDGRCDLLSIFKREGVYQIPVDSSEKLLVNVGSVGQPRDEDPRAAYVIYDTEDCTLQLIRVAYDIRVVQERIRQKGLPHVLAERLSYGL
ncbi:MAG: metallophosphoesterase family protein [Planctomycetes bacterium]|nr:metallophosphoesterase family protein [Planctomycetota bacterium]MCB9891305.1 metallophosphoesterase family protein [Planctomycetota bacterium]MCB9919436.1 metallophosphoesterase family protein [Planctomycetota bacterium]